MIRQTITCDICGAEKKQTNHWFVVHEQGDELRLTGWSSRSRLRPGTKHLCGQVCLHKLADIFMARVIAEKAAPAKEAATDESLLLPRSTSDASLKEDTEFESSARLIPAPSILPRATVQPSQPEFKAHLEVTPQPDFVSALARLKSEELTPSVTTSFDEPPPNASRNWRAEAWEREREREQRAQQRNDDSSARRRFN